MLSHRYLPKPDDLGPDPEPVGARFDAILRADPLAPDERTVAELVELAPVEPEPRVPVAA